MTPTWWRHVPYKSLGDEVTSYSNPVDSLCNIYYPVNLTSHPRLIYSLMFNLFVLFMYIVKSARPCYLNYHVVCMSIYDTFLVILVGVRGDRTRNPWIGSRVFYHWAKWGGVVCLFTLAFGLGPFGEHIHSFYIFDYTCFFLNRMWVLRLGFKTEFSFKIQHT